MVKISLFNSGPNYGHRIRFNFPKLEEGSYSWTLFETGYEEAFEILSKELINRQNKGVVPKYECLIFPIIFIFRHYCEIAVKELIHSSRIILELPLTKNYNHPLDKLWTLCKELLRKVDEKYDFASINVGFNSSEILENIEAVILELNGMDESSQAFRYPSKKGTSLLVKLDSIDIHYFYNQVKFIITDIRNLDTIIIFIKNSKEKF